MDTTGKNIIDNIDTIIKNLRNIFNEKGKGHIIF